MSGEIIAIVSVGIGLGLLSTGLFAWLRTDLVKVEERLAGQHGEGRGAASGRYGEGRGAATDRHGEGRGTVTSRPGDG